MGLDVFFRLAKKTRERKANEPLCVYIRDIRDEEDARCLKLFKVEIKEEMKKVRAAEKEWKKNNSDKANDFDLSAHCRYALNELAWTAKKYLIYDFQRDFIMKAKTVKELADGFKEEYKSFYKPYTAYFRKVNCVYRYFSDKLEDEMCIVDKEDVIDIMNRAIRILENKDTDLAAEILPTQDGFFFGPTEYGSWYFEDMVEILKEFGKLLNEWEDDDICYVVMSW